MDIPLDEVVYFDAISSSATGAAVDCDSTPTFAVYEESTDTDIGVGGNMTKRTSLTGNYRGSFTASAANGFEAGKFYAVIGSATIGGIATKGVLREFRIAAAENTAGVRTVDTVRVGGTTQTARDIGASVLLSSGTGTGQVKLSSGYVAPNWGDVGNPTTSVNLSGTTTNLVNTATTLTNAPSDSSGTTTLLSRLTSTRAGYLDNLSAGAVATASALTSAASDITTLLGKFTGITLVKEWLGLLAGKQTGNSTARTELRATGAGSGTFDETTDSLEGIRDRGDAAWITATGFSTLDASGVRAAVGLASANLDTQLADIPTVAEFEARTLAAAAYFDFTTDSVTVGTNNDKTGYSLTNLTVASTVTLAAGTHNPQSGDAYGVVNNDTHGNAALKTLIDTVDTVADGVKAKTDQLDFTGTAGALKSESTNMRGTDGAYTGTPPTAVAIRQEIDSNSTQLAKLGTPAGASVSADIAAAKTEIDKIPRTGETHTWTNTGTAAAATVEITEP